MAVSPLRKSIFVAPLIEVVEQLTALAKRNSRTINAEACIAIGQYLEREKATATQQQASPAPRPSLPWAATSAQPMSTPRSGASASGHDSTGGDV
jgi:hypothetical protein